MQRPAGDVTGFLFRQVAMQALNASASARSRRSPPSCWARRALSSNNVLQSPAAPPFVTDFQCATMLTFVTRQLIENRWRRRGGCLKHQIVAVDLDMDAGGPRRLQGFCRTHSR